MITVKNITPPPSSSLLARTRERERAKQQNKKYLHTVTNEEIGVCCYSF